MFQCSMCQRLDNSVPTLSEAVAADSCAALKYLSVFVRVTDSRELDWSGGIVLRGAEGKVIHYYQNETDQK